PRSGGGIIETSTDMHGHYKLRVAPGSSYVYIDGATDGYLTNDVGSRLTVAQGESKDCSFKLSPGITVTGTVVDITGQPVGGQSLKLDPVSNGWWVTTQSDAEGGFKFTGIEPGLYRIHIGNGMSYAIAGANSFQLPSNGPLKLKVTRVS